MKWFLLLLIFLAGIYYLLNQGKNETKKEMIQLAKKEEIIALPEPALPVKLKKDYLLKLSPETIKTLRELTGDSNEKVRFAAAELLWQLQDESVHGVLKYMLENETEPSMKKSIIALLSKDKTRLSLALLAEALKDSDKETRLAAVAGIGSFSDKEAISALKSALVDYDEEVRLKALEAVNNIRRDIEARKEQQLRELNSSNKPLLRID